MPSTLRRDEASGGPAPVEGTYEIMSVLIALGSCALGVYVIWWWTAGPGRGQKIKTTYRRARGPERLFTPFGSKWVAQHKTVTKPGWWRASDGKLYPPHQHPNYRPPPPPPP